MPNKYHFLTCSFDITLAYKNYTTQVLRNDFFNITKNHHSPSLFYRKMLQSSDLGIPDVRYFETLIFILIAENTATLYKLIFSIFSNDRDHFFRITDKSPGI